MQLAEYHKLARKLKLIPVSAENSKGHDFEIQFNPEAGPNCLVKYRTQIKVSRVNTTFPLQLTKKCVSLEMLERCLVTSP